MDEILGIALLVLGVPLALFAWLIVRSFKLGRQVTEARADLAELRVRFDLLKDSLAVAPAPSRPAPQIPEPRPAPAPVHASPPALPPSLPKPAAAVAPPLPELAAPASREPEVETPPVPGFLASVNWENFLGIKLFAWVGGFVLFLAVAFFLKYSFENNLISPPVRIAIGYVLGAGLMVGSLLLPREKYAISVQSLCASAVLVLYGSTFAAHAFYKLIPAAPTFGVMILVTAVAFLLSMRLDAQAVAILGLLGGFATPPLLATGADNPLGLFGYVALLDAGLAAVAVRKRWGHLLLMAAVATAAMQVGWTSKFFEVAKFPTALAIYGGFPFFFLLAHLAERRWSSISGKPWGLAAAGLLPLVAFAFVLYLLARPYPALAARTLPLFGFLFTVDLVLLALAWLDARAEALQYVGGLAVFVLLAIWNLAFLKDPLLNAALAASFVFAALHSVFPLALRRARPSSRAGPWAQAFPPLALLLILLPVLKLHALSPLVWVVILLVNLLVFGLAALTATLAGAVAALLLTLVTLAAWILRAPLAPTLVPGQVLLLGGFALFFFGAGAWAARRIAARAAAAPGGGAPAADELPADPSRAVLPVGSAVLPFALLIMMVARLPLANPSPVFGLAALLVVLLLGVARFLRVDLLPLVGLLAALALEAAWHATGQHGRHPGIALGWYLGFTALFFAFPFLFRAEMEDRLLPWVAAALAAPLHFPLVYHLVQKAWPNPFMGALPALFALPALAALAFLARALPWESPSRLSLLAWFGGVALFFVTLVFPVQFEKQWITVGWALEGAALLWFFHRVPHPGLRLVGCSLLAVAFARLALNPQVFEYHARGNARVLNWYLYGYGITTACLFAGGRLLAPPRHRLGRLHVSGALYGLGVVLAFLLLNIEIADWFSAGPRIEFRFTASLGQDMTYSIAWALFAFVVLLAGILRDVAVARWAGLGLLTATLVKLFLHDLWRLGQLYRVGSLVGLAVVLLLVSFIYQRFVAAKRAPQPPAP
jgi:uncharacterized membrane protein